MAERRASKPSGADIGGSDDDGRAQGPVDRPLQHEGIHIGAGVEAHHLAPGVHTGVGSPRARQFDGVPQRAFQGAGQGAGDGDLSGLQGEAVKPVSVVGDEQAQPHRGPGGNRSRC